MPFNFQVCFGAGGDNISPFAELLGAGVDGTVDGAVDGELAIGRLTAGGGSGGAHSIGGKSKGLLASGGVVFGVGALETSVDTGTGLL